MRRLLTLARILGLAVLRGHFVQEEASLGYFGFDEVLDEADVEVVAAWLVVGVPLVRGAVDAVLEVEVERKPFLLVTLRCLD